MFIKGKYANKKFKIEEQVEIADLIRTREGLLRILKSKDIVEVGKEKSGISEAENADLIRRREKLLNILKSKDIVEVEIAHLIEKREKLLEILKSKDISEAEKEKSGILEVEIANLTDLIRRKKELLRILKIKGILEAGKKESGISEAEKEEILSNIVITSDAELIGLISSSIENKHLKVLMDNIRMPEEYHENRYLLFSMIKEKRAELINSEIFTRGNKSGIDLYCLYEEDTYQVKEKFKELITVEFLKSIIHTPGDLRYVYKLKEICEEKLKELITVEFLEEITHNKVEEWELYRIKEIDPKILAEFKERMKLNQEKDNNELVRGL